MLLSLFRNSVIYIYTCYIRKFISTCRGWEGLIFDRALVKIKKFRNTQFFYIKIGLLLKNQPFYVFFSTTKVQLSLGLSRGQAFVDYIKGLKRLDTQLNKPTNQNLLKSPKFLSQQIRKCYYKTLGTSVINSPLSPLSLSQILPFYHLLFEFISFNAPLMFTTFINHTTNQLN